MPASHPSQFRSEFSVTVFASTLLASMTLYRPECANSRRACLLTSFMVAVLLAVLSNSDAAGLTSSSSNSNTAILTGGEGKTERKDASGSDPREVSSIPFTSSKRSHSHRQVHRRLPKVARRGARITRLANRIDRSAPGHHHPHLGLDHGVAHEGDACNLFSHRAQSCSKIRVLTPLASHNPVARCL